MSGTRKIAVITGAGAGIGRAAADEFARHGHDVALLSRDAERLTRAAVQIEARFGVRALAIPTDVADARAVEAAASHVEDTRGPIDVWVNVAMATAFAPVSADSFNAKRVPPACMCHIMIYI